MSPSASPNKDLFGAEADKSPLQEPKASAPTTKHPLSPKSAAAPLPDPKTKSKPSERERAQSPNPLPKATTTPDAQDQASITPTAVGEARTPARGPLKGTFFSSNIQSHGHPPAATSRQIAVPFQEGAAFDIVQHGMTQKPISANKKAPPKKKGAKKQVAFKPFREPERGGYTPRQYPIPAPHTNINPWLLGPVYPPQAARDAAPYPPAYTLAETAIDAKVKAVVQAQSAHIHEEGRQLGHGQGYTTGRTQGHNQGFAEGKNKGYDQGFSAGHTQGYATGFKASHAEGYNQIKQQGHAEGVAEAGFANAEIVADHARYTALFDILYRTRRDGDMVRVDSLITEA